MEKTSTVIEDRRKKIDRLKEIGINPYPAGFKYNLKTCEAVEKFGHINGEELEKDHTLYSLAGRIMSMRIFGKAAFIHIKDSSGSIQAYIRKDKVGDECSFDHGSQSLPPLVGRLYPCSACIGSISEL